MQKKQSFNLKLLSVVALATTLLQASSLQKNLDNKLSQKEINEIESILPIGWAHGDRYSQKQWIGPEKYS